MFRFPSISSMCSGPSQNRPPKYCPGDASVCPHLGPVCRASNSDFWLLEEKISVPVSCPVCKDLSLHCPCMVKWNGHWCYGGAPSQHGHCQLCLDYTFASALPVPFPVGRGGEGLWAASLQAAVPTQQSVRNVQVHEWPWLLSASFTSHLGGTHLSPEGNRILSELISGVTYHSQSGLHLRHTSHDLIACCSLMAFLLAVA